eukprot:TRINITY_DN66396_c8_g5_i1.p2 TRINITY_DN66396_c8_g5~~TRINITY_DN66396_c8_g5_i1.p2  ORF type:complete len:129 (-),score=2.35 TRINITY_DN66396_c8_g5_i1:28-414(-)
MRDASVITTGALRGWNQSIGCGVQAALAAVCGFCFEWRIKRSAFEQYPARHLRTPPVASVSISFFVPLVQTLLFVAFVWTVVVVASSASVRARPSSSSVLVCFSFPFLSSSLSSSLSRVWCSMLAVLL